MNTKIELKKGNIVSVYQKPITREDYEGEAKLLHMAKMYQSIAPDGCEAWEVRFLDDGFIQTRFIKTNQ